MASGTFRHGDKCYVTLPLSDQSLACFEAVYLGDKRDLPIIAVHESCPNSLEVKVTPIATLGVMLVPKTSLLAAPSDGVTLTRLGISFDHRAIMDLVLSMDLPESI